MAVDPVSIGLGVASLATGILGSKSANKAAKRAAREQAALTGMQRDEEIRQLRRSKAQQAGMSRAAIGASNIQFSGSAQRYARALDFENLREIAWAERAKRAEQRAIRAGARGAGDALMYQAVGQALSYGIQGLFSRTPSDGGSGT